MKAFKLSLIILFLVLLAGLTVPAAAANIPPRPFGKLNPVDGSLQPTNVVLRWEASGGAMGYSYCVQTSSALCDPTAYPANWITNGTSTSVIPPGLSNHITYYWQVRAGNLFGTTYADSGTFWSFTTGDVPGSFFKSTPAYGDGGETANATVLSWTASSSVDHYEYCYDIASGETCDDTWKSANLDTSVTLSGLDPNTTYYWQVRAVNSNGSTEANGGAWWYFVTRPILMVTNANASGDGSLSKAVDDSISGDIINFAADYNIFLASTLSIDENLTIDGSGHTITISGDTDVNGTPDVRDFSIGTHGVVTLNHLSVVNGMSNLYGGGIYNFGTLTVTDSSIFGNTSAVSNASGQGGGIYNETGATLTVVHSTLVNNSAGFSGGGIENLGNLTVTDSIFSNNSIPNTSGGMGGGIHNDGDLTVQGSTFTGNTAGSFGGGILTSSTGDMTVTNSTFFNNSAQVGGAINVLSSSGTLSVTNTTIYGNTASEYGGGMYLYGSTLTLRNTIVANNTAPTDANCSGSPADGGNNLWSGETSSSCPGTHSDPQLGALADNGGPTQTMAPDLGSPAIDAYDANCPATDQRGVARPQGAHCDIGAVEVLTISGNSILSGVTLSYNDGGDKTAASAPDGSYVLSVSYGWSGNVTPSLTGYTFTPDHRDYAGVSSNRTGQDYSPLVTISGSTGVAGTTITYTGGSTVAGGSGLYSFTVAYNWSGTVTPSMAGYTFSPASRDYSATPVTISLTGQDFTPTAITYTISGNAGDAGVKLSYIDGTAKSVTSASNGRYTLSVPSGWSGTVTPSKTGLSFTPTSRAYASVTANKTGQNFSAIRTFTSTGSQDGWILESTEISNTGGSMNATATTFQLGDDSQNRQYRAILSFNTASLPDTATIKTAVLKIKQSGSPVGTNPFTVLGALYADLRKGFFGTSAALQLTDFNATASAAKAAHFGATPVSSWYSAALNATGRGSINKTNLTQFRLYFSLDDNNNHLADFMRFISGNSTGSGPQLVITYTLP